MKKQWTMVVVCLLAVCLFILPVQAEAAEITASGTCGEGVTWTLEDTGLLTISGTGAMADYATASEVPWYSQRASVLAVTVADGVTTIGDRAFYNCTALTEVSIGGSVTGIGNYAFRGCTALEAVTIPESVTSIGAYAFYNCENLTSIMIPDGVESIGQEAFMSCTSLVSVTIPQSVSYVGYEAFYFCSNIREVYITDIGAWCNIYFGDSVANPLYYAEHLYINGEEECDISIPEGVQAIKSYSFYNCQQLKSIAIPDSVTTIGRYAFKNCTGLTSIAIPSSTTALLKDSFRNCNNLTTVYLSKNTTLIDELTFDACPISDVYFDGTELDRNNISIGAHNVALTDATWHYNICETHIYDNTCDDSCNQCGWIRVGAGHIYSTGCDADCDRCGYIREAAHQYTLNENHTCSFCKYSKTPVAPTLANCTENSITLTAHEGFEYSKDGETWQTSNLFDNLTRGTEYTFYQRIEETESAFASESSPALTAKTLTDYTVSYYANGGTSAPANQTKKANTDLILSNTKPTYPGHTFLGWSTTPYGEIEYKSGDRYSQNCDLVLYAKWGITHSACEGMGYSVTESSWTETCTTCSGYGFVDGTGFGCLRCKGTSMTVWNGMMQCTTCKDATYIYKNVDPCTSCGRKGYHTRVEKTEYPCYGCNQKGYLLIENVQIAAPTLLYVGNTSVELVPVDGAEYSKDGISWQTSNVFNNLNLTTTYWFYQRYAANDINLAGPSSEALCITIQQELMRTLVCKNYDNTIYLTDTYQEGDDVPFPTQNPVKPSDETYFYTFEKWEFVESESSEKRKVYIATFKSAPIDYTVIFQDYDGREISKKTDYHFGDAVTAPADPTRIADEMYTYTFAGWDNDVVDCAGNATYTATYTPTYIDYTVVFKNWDGTVLSTKAYHYGDAVQEPDAPTKESDAYGVYTFAGWDKPVTACTADASYTATYSLEYTDYTVVFKNWNGEVLSTNTYHCGDAVTAPADPTKAADNTYTYAFAGWDQNVVDCAGDAAYTATYTPTYIEYTVTFQYEDGTVIKQYVLHYADAVEPPADFAVPDALSRYQFVGWDSEVVACQKDTVYTAVFVRKYPVGDIDENNSVNTEDVIQLLLYISMPDLFPIGDTPADFTGDGEVNTDDAIQLLLHISMPDVFPLETRKRENLSI